MLYSIPMMVYLVALQPLPLTLMHNTWLMKNNEKYSINCWIAFIYRLYCNKNLSRLPNEERYTNSSTNLFVTPCSRWSFFIFFPTLRATWSHSCLIIWEVVFWYLSKITYNRGYCFTSIIFWPNCNWIYFICNHCKGQGYNITCYHAPIVQIRICTAEFTFSKNNVIWVYRFFSIPGQRCKE